MAIAQLTRAVFTTFKTSYFANSVRIIPFIGRTISPVAPNDDVPI